MVLASDDGGNTWRTQTTGTTDLLTGVWTDGRGRVVVSGVNTLIESSNGGAEWHPVGPKPQASLVAVSAAARGAGAARVMTVGTAATVLELPR
jgi:hypothetical protein